MLAAVGVQLLLYKITQDHKYADGVRAYLDSWHTMQRTPKGLAWFNEWAPNRYAANTAFVSLLAADYGIDPDANREWAVQQVRTTAHKHRENQICRAYTSVSHDESGEG